MTAPGTRRAPRTLLLAIVLLQLATFAAPASAGNAAPPKPVTPLSPRLALLAAGPASAAELSLPARGPGSLIETPAGEILIYLRLHSARPGDLDALTAAGARLVEANPRYGVVTAAVLPRHLAALAALPGLLDAREALEPARREGPTIGRFKMQEAPSSGGPCPSGVRVAEADAILRAAEARAAFRVDGGGVTVGVLSGSFDVSRETQVRAATDVSTGDLPGPGNPCGHADPVQVLAETRIAAGRDEGRAMLQIVHDLAPGAHLAFATAGDGLYAFAENIRRLRREARADIIVDDYYYPEEPMFQDGPISVAIRDVTADGALYVTSGGNIHVEDRRGRAIGSYEAPAFRPVVCPALTASGGAAVAAGADCHDFDPGERQDPGLGMVLPPGGSLSINFQWSEPWFGVRTDLDVYLADQAGTVLASSTAGIGPAPFEFLAYVNETGAEQPVQLVVGRFSGELPRLKFTLGSADIYATPPSAMEYVGEDTPDRFGPTIVDHAASAHAIVVAASREDDPLRLEGFSSRGPATLYWGPVDSIRPAPPLAPPDVRAKPDVTALSGVQTTFYRRLSRETPQRCDPADPAQACRFFGTSAASPQVAGVLALMLQRARALGGGLGVEQARAVLAQTAQPLRDVPVGSGGAGLVDAMAAVGAVRPSPPAPVVMPDVVGLGELQAKEALLRAGIPLAQVVVDYQGRAKLGELFDRAAPFEVVSAQPRAGEGVAPGQVVVLGVRAPE